MNVFRLDADVNNYRGIVLACQNDVVEFNRRFDGTPMKAAWTGKRKFVFVPRAKRKGDTPGLSSHIPVFNERSVEALRYLLEPNGELLPMTCEGERYYLFNITRVVDALDEPGCDLKLFRDGSIMAVERYSFLEDRLIGEAVFKLPQELLSYPFCTDPFVQRVKAAGLKGFKFDLLWSSD